MDKSILIAGASGQVGHELAIAQGLHRLIPLTRSDLDIESPEAIEKAFDTHKPDIVINAAAYTAVDKAEHESDAAFAINRDSVGNLARACKQAGIPLLHISTDYVFDGEKNGAWREDDPIAPQSTYGLSKAAGEAMLRDSLDQHIILRTSWVFSATGSNFVKTMLRLGKERDELGIVDDQHGCPTSARSIAAVLLHIAHRYLEGREVSWGTYHYCNQPETSWYDFARAIFETAAGYENLKLKPIKTSEYLTPAARPKNSVLDCGKLETDFELKPAEWLDELRNVLDQTK